MKGEGCKFYFFLKKGYSRKKSVECNSSNSYVWVKGEGYIFRIIARFGFTRWLPTESEGKTCAHVRPAHAWFYSVSRSQLRTTKRKANVRSLAIWKSVLRPVSTKIRKFDNRLFWKAPGPVRIYFRDTRRVGTPYDVGRGKPGCAKKTHLIWRK